MKSTKLFRRAVAKSFTEVLCPAGFERSKVLFTRASGGQIHGVQFQPSKLWNSYYLNVAFHYDFLPGMLRKLDRGVSYREFKLVDFMLDVRIRSLFRGAFPKQWSCDGDPADVASTMMEVAQCAVDDLERLGGMWSKPRILLQLLPPELLESDYRGALLRTNDPAERINSAVGFEWSPDYEDLSYCLAVIAARNRDLTTAEAYLSLMTTMSDGSLGALEISQIRRDLRRHAENPSDS